MDPFACHRLRHYAPSTGPMTARSDALDSCPVTARRDHSSFMPPSQYLQRVTATGTFWYGSEELWIALDTNGIWRSERQPDPGVYTAKLMYWTENFHWRAEPEPNLRITARRLDQQAPVIIGGPAHAVFVTGPMPAAMMSGITIPVSGCWQITASYRGHNLSFLRKVLVQR